MAGRALAAPVPAGRRRDAARHKTVVEIKPDRIILLDIDKTGDRLVAVGERGFVLYLGRRAIPGRRARHR